jgi:glycosyltransferase involved in cell wall biosynthesis
MPTPSPLVTVIIPTYNWSAVLPYSIGSVLRQTLADFELLVIGDGCTDDSEAVVRAVGDPRIRWINLPKNTGIQSGPNNEGLRLARGEFIAYLGHDDLWLPHHLSSLTGCMGQVADLAYGVTLMVGPEGSFVVPAPPLSVYWSGAWIAPTAIVHRRRVTEHVGGWRDYRELDCDPETDLWRRAYEGGYRFAFMSRLTSVKFPAAWRRDVYKLRPHHEQAAWLERIDKNPGFEIEYLVKMLEIGKPMYAKIFAGASPSPPVGGSEVEIRRKFKGLPPNP